MSLLLDALKKAEAEKRRRSSAFGGRETDLPPRAVAAAQPSRAARDKVELALEELGPVPGADAPSADVAAPEPERADAEILFAAKEPGPSRRNVLLIAGGLVILLLALGGGYYVWQETSRPSLATPPRGPVASAPVLPPPAPSVVPAPPVPRSEPVMVIEPRGGVPPAAAPERPMVPERVDSGPPAAEAAPARAPAPQPPAGPSIRVTRGETEAAMDPSVSAAYESLRRGDLGAAETNYRAALQADPRNRDALLGLGALAAKAGQRDAAERYYRAALALNPRDPLAVAGLLGVRGPEGSTVIESRLKTLLADQPDAAFLHYSLGNHYASQARWGEAQQAYFQAFRAEPGNPDFAFNLAVSLDQLAQNQLAAEYYRKALALAERSPAAFDRAAAGNRLRELGQ